MFQIVVNEHVLVAGVSGALAEDSSVSAGELLKASSCTDGGRVQRSSTSSRMATTSACTALGRLVSQVSFFSSYLEAIDVIALGYIASPRP